MYVFTITGARKDLTLYMTFDNFMVWYKKQGGTQKGFGLEMGISEAQMSRIVHRKQRIGLRMLNRMFAAGGGRMSMGELCAGSL